ncbi:MAG: type II toxin-antitoxin system RelE/ParE family toxin [Lachnospiraceae bacterium]|jgi:plasmid stabilization system protein ParE|nr:type II toxin-antitoxin system RelE/ParE family toxin [Lachnospiraceae bacterium]
MTYNAIITKNAKLDFENIISYLINILQNNQAAINVINDFEETIKTLSKIAKSLKYCDTPKLKDLGYKKIKFSKHDYLILFRINGHDIIIDDIFHCLQDYEHILT